MSDAAEEDSKRLNLSTVSNQIGKIKDRLTHHVQPIRVTTIPAAGSLPTEGEKTTQRKEECCRCGGDHNQDDCPYKEYNCNYCKKKGHLAQS